MKILLTLVLLASIIGCSKDSAVSINDNGSRVTDIENRLDIIESSLLRLTSNLETTNTLLTSEVARLDQADSDNLDQIESNLDDAVEDLENMIRAGDRRLSRQLRSTRRSLMSAIRRGDYQVSMRLGRQISALESELDDAVENLERSDSRLNDRINRANRNRRRLARRLRRFQAYQAGRDRGQDIAMQQGLIAMASQFGSQMNTVLQRLNSIDGSITTLVTTTNALEIAVGLLTTDLSNLTSTVGSILIDLSALNAEVDHLGDDVDELEDDVDNNASDIALLQGSSSCTVSFYSVHTHNGGSYYGGVRVTCGNRYANIHNHVRIYNGGNN